MGAASTVTLTGPAPASKVMSFSQNGSLDIAITFIPEVDIVLTATGRNLISVPKHGDYPGGLFLTIGKVFWSLNAPDYPNGGLAGPGIFDDDKAKHFYYQLAWFSKPDGTSLLQGLTYGQRAGTFDFVPQVFPGLTRSEVSWRISDHYPLWCEFLLT